MPFVPFMQFFPELAQRETRCVVLPEGDDSLPAGKYDLLELFCNEPNCDCRRVMLMVGAVRMERMVATISFGWEPAEFYAEWMRNDDPDVIELMKGPVLEPMGRQSEYAEEILNLVETVVLRDDAYVERIKRHYCLFRQHIDGPRPLRSKKIQFMDTKSGMMDKKSLMKDRKKKRLARKKKRKQSRR